MTRSANSAKRLPDGGFEVDGKRYTLNEVGDGRFEVLLAAEAAPVGELELVPGQSAPKVTSGGAEDSVLNAIAELLAQPRGSLPLQ